MTNQRYSLDDLKAVSDNPELTASDLAAARPFGAAFPAAAAAMRARRGPQKSPTKVATTIRLSREVVEHFRRGGQGWQSRIDAALREWMAAHR